MSEGGPIHRQVTFSARYALMYWLAIDIGQD